MLTLVAAHSRFYRLPSRKRFPPAGSDGKSDLTKHPYLTPIYVASFQADMASFVPTWQYIVVTWHRMALTRYGMCSQVGLEDWELSRIRVNLLQQAGAHDLLERLSMLSPLPGHSGGERSNNFQKMFSKRAARTSPSLQRCSLSWHLFGFSAPGRQTL